MAIYIKLTFARLEGDYWADRHVWWCVGRKLYLLRLKLINLKLARLMEFAANRQETRPTLLALQPQRYHVKGATSPSETIFPQPNYCQRPTAKSTSTPNDNPSSHPNRQDERNS